MSLRLGKEIFDIQKTTENVPRPGIPTSQSQPQSSPEKLNRGGAANGLTYLVQQHKRAGVLQAEAAITGTMALRPTGMKSETHRMLVGAVRQKHNKVARLRMTADPTVDPERELMEEIKRDSRNNKPRRNRQPREDDFDLGMDNPRNARKQRRTGGGGGRRRRGEDMYSDEDEDEEPQWSDEDNEDASPRRKAKGDQDADGRRGGEYQPDDFLVADSDEAGSDDDKSRRKRKKRSRDEQSDEDELDKLDAQIAKQQQARKAAGGGDGYDDGPQDKADAQGTPEEKMDLESEEEDDDFNVRKAGGSSRRKRAFQEEEEDDQ
jgi:RNA polymerase-associated protein LEO1